MHAVIDIGRAVFDIGLLKNIADYTQFMEYLFEPQFIGLVNDDEEHFIIGPDAFFSAFRVLRIQYFIELQVIAVVNGASFLLFHAVKLVKVGASIKF